MQAAKLQRPQSLAQKAEPKAQIRNKPQTANLNWPFSGSFPDLVAWPVAWPLWSSAVLSVGGAEAAVHCRALRVDALGTFAGDLRDALSVQGVHQAQVLL